MNIDKLIRSDRKTIALIVTSKGEVIIRAPYHVSEKYLKDFVLSKKDWIIEKKELVKKEILENQQRTYADGDKFLLYGNYITLKITAGINKIVLKEYDLLFPEKMLSHPDFYLEDWYKRIALSYLGQQTYKLSVKYGFDHKTVKINSARKRWGSCSFHNSINFSWRLIMAPIEVIDYVIIHELCHTSIKDHSAVFWQKVVEIVPDYKKCKQWLKDNGRKMNI